MLDFAALVCLAWLADIAAGGGANRSWRSGQRGMDACCWMTTTAAASCVGGRGAAMTPPLPPPGSRCAAGTLRAWQTRRPKQRQPQRQPQRRCSRPVVCGLDSPASLPIETPGDYASELSTLQRYVVNIPRHGVVGSSNYAKKLRRRIREEQRRKDYYAPVEDVVLSKSVRITQGTAAEQEMMCIGPSRRPVMVFGEPGLEKDNIAALIHFGSPRRRSPMFQMECGRLSGIRGYLELFGGRDKKGLLDYIGNGTLLLNQVEQLPLEAFASIWALASSGEYYPLGEVGEETSLRKSRCKVIFTGEKTIVGNGAINIASIPDMTTIKVPPLRIRKEDVAELFQYNLRIICKLRRTPIPIVVPEAKRRLERYSYPQNERELYSITERAVDLSIKSSRSNIITEEMLWYSSDKTSDLYKVDLFQSLPILKTFARSPAWPDLLNMRFTVYAFAIGVAILMWGPQDREHNFVLNLFWAWWWPVEMIAYLFVGRAWCSVCPFMIYGEIVQAVRRHIGPELRTWPKSESERYGAWALFVMFALILMWEELWDLNNTAYLSGWLLLLITFGAMICSAIFQRRYWCRYLCPIGGMNGLMAKLSLIELRAAKGVCDSNCSTFTCFKGGPAVPPEGMETFGCPVWSHPANLEDNRDCVLCMTCVKACPHKSIGLFLRPPGWDLWSGHKATPAEVALMLLLLGDVFMLQLPELLEQFGVDPLLLNRSFLDHALFSALSLGSPALFLYMAYRLSKFLDQEDSFRDKTRSFVALSYAYLPIVWSGLLAHYLSLNLGEGGKVVQVAAKTFHMEQYVDTVPALVADPSVISFLQGFFVVTGTVYSLILLRKIGRVTWTKLLPMGAAVLGIGFEYFELIVNKV